MLTEIYIQDFIKWFVTSPFVYSCLALIVIIMFGTHLLLMIKAVYNGKTYVTSDGLTLLSYTLLLSFFGFCLDYLLQIMITLNNMILFQRIDPTLLSRLMLPVHIMCVLIFQMSMIVLFICLFKTKKTLN